MRRRNLLGNTPEGRIQQIAVLLDPKGDGSVPPMITPEEARELMELPL